MTQDEIAKELNISKSTVSRALSGKGRIGAKTRQRVLDYALEQGRLNDKAVKTDGTHNLGVIFPADVYENVNAYFHECLLGICEVSSLMGYNVLLATGTANDISEIKKLVEEGKVEGIILTRSQKEDRAVEYLTKKGFPVGMTGTCEYKEVIQVDADNEGATENMISLFIGRGYKRFALIVDELRFRVNWDRYNGFCKALQKHGMPKEKQAFYIGTLKADVLDTIIHDIIARKIECIICGDDLLCTRVVSKLQSEGFRIPRDISIASLYNGSNLNCFTPSITAINISARQTGNMIGRQMINYLNGNDYQAKTVIDYEILYRKSTNRL